MGRLDDDLTRQAERVKIRDTQRSLTGIQTQIKTCLVNLGRATVESERVLLKRDLEKLEKTESALMEALAEVMPTPEPKQASPITKVTDTSKTAVTKALQPKKPSPAPTPNKPEVMERLLVARIIVEVSSYLSLATNGIVANPGKINASLLEIAALPENSRRKKALQGILSEVLQTRKIDAGRILVNELRAL